MRRPIGKRLMSYGVETSRSTTHLNGRPNPRSLAPVENGGEIVPFRASWMACLPKGAAYSRLEVEEELALVVRPVPPSVPGGVEPAWDPFPLSLPVRAYDQMT